MTRASLPVYSLCLWKPQAYHGPPGLAAELKHQMPLPRRSHITAGPWALLKLLSASGAYQPALAHLAPLLTSLCEGPQFHQIHNCTPWSKRAKREQE